jgi:hypothetical protein
MILVGNIVDVGDLGGNERGVRLQLADARRVTITGLSVDETRIFARMVNQPIEIRFSPMHERDRWRDDETPAKPYSNFDEATGIRKTGPI